MSGWVSSKYGVWVFLCLTEMVVSPCAPRLGSRAQGPRNPFKVWQGGRGFRGCVREGPFRGARSEGGFRVRRGGSWQGSPREANEGGGGVPGRGGGAGSCSALDASWNSSSQEAPP